MSDAWGGLEMATLENSLHFVNSGVKCQLICSKNGRLHLAGDRTQLRVLPVGVPQNRFVRYFDFRLIRQIAKVIGESQVKTVIVQRLSDLWAVVPALRGYPQVKLVVVSHILMSVSKKDFLHSRLYDRIDRLIALTEIHKQNLLTHLPIAPEKISVVPNGVDVSRFHPSRASFCMRDFLGGMPERILFGVVGRFDVLKGQREVLQAAIGLIDQGYEFSLAFVGDDTHRGPSVKSEILQAIEDHGLEDYVRVLPFQKDIEEVMASLDVLVVPSFEETFGRVVIESMAAGTAVLGTKSGGIPEILDHGRIGVLVEPRSVASLEEGMKKFLDTPELVADLGRSARQHVVKRYSESVVNERFHTEIKNL